MKIHAQDKSSTSLARRLAGKNQNLHVYRTPQGVCILETLISRLPEARFVEDMTFPETQSTNFRVSAWDFGVPGVFFYTEV